MKAKISAYMVKDEQGTSNKAYWAARIYGDAVENQESLKESFDKTRKVLEKLLEGMGDAGFEHSEEAVSLPRIEADEITESRGKLDC